jgi:hypothetical protein
MCGSQPSGTLPSFELYFRAPQLANDKRPWNKAGRLALVARHRALRHPLRALCGAPHSTRFNVVEQLYSLERELCHSSPWAIP